MSPPDGNRIESREPLPRKKWDRKIARTYRDVSKRMSNNIVILERATIKSPLFSACFHQQSGKIFTFTTRLFEPAQRS